MQKNKYLDDLGLKITKYGTNWCEETDTERSKEWIDQRNNYGFDSRETWNLDYTFVEWLYSRLMMYKEVNNVNLKCHKIIYDNVEYNQGEAIDYIIDACKNYLIVDTSDVEVEEEMYRKMIYATHIWAEVMPYMWW